jgi:hypothetical protein
MSKYFIFCSIVLILLVSCEKSFEPFNLDSEYKYKDNNLNFIFKYGINSKNVLNTINCTFTKDMVCDSSITIFLQLSNAEKDSIFNKLQQISILSYPDTFHVKLSSDTIVYRTPYSSYYFYVQINEEIKELYWDDRIINFDEDAVKLRELSNFIINIIATKNEYIKLPKPKCLYV